MDADRPSTHLERDELVALTGYKQPTRMTAWLTARSWVFEPAARRGDIPKVARAYHDARMSGQDPAASPADETNGVTFAWMLEPA